MISRQEKLNAPDAEQDPHRVVVSRKVIFRGANSNLFCVARNGGLDVTQRLLDQKVAHPAGHERRLGANAKQGPCVVLRTRRAVFDPELSRAARGNG